MTGNPFIPFSKAAHAPNQLAYLEQALASGATAGGGPFSSICEAWIENRTGCDRALLTQSCTAALEMAALLTDIEPGDEVIMPSWTFASTANAFILRGGVPVFVDIDAESLNIDTALVEDAISSRTRAICVVHYAGVACNMDEIIRIAKNHNLFVIEDAAQAIGSTYRGQSLGAIGELGAFSFHGTKNISCGEGGALVINRRGFSDKAEILREKGTDRSRFLRGETDKYTWRDIGSSYVPSELTAAVLAAQFEVAGQILANRLDIWNAYHHQLISLDPSERLKRPIIPTECTHNGHIYHIRTSDLSERDSLLAAFRKNNIAASFHYVPLHSSPAGIRFGRTASGMAVTDDTSRTLIRLPIWDGLLSSEVARILAIIEDFLNEL